VTLEDQLRYAREHLLETTVGVLDGMRTLAWKVTVGEHWSPQALQLVVMIPPAYPAQAPSGFDVVGSVSVHGANPAGAGQRNVGGDVWIHFCWNPSGQIPYGSVDGIWKFAKFCEARFRETH